MLKVHCVPAFQDNYIWLVGSADSDRVAIVDPGIADPVIASLEALHLTPEAILVTHHHGDHTGGVVELASRYSMPVYGPTNEHIAAVSNPVSEGDRIGLPGCGLEFSVWETPGHTRGHVCYVGHGALFSGDTLFTAGCGRLFEGDAEQMYTAMERIRGLPDDTLLYCAHEYTEDNLAFARVAEPDSEAVQERQALTRQLRNQGKPSVPGTIGEEKRSNPFLRYDNPQLKTAAEAWAGHALASPVDVFATVRRWKDALD